MGKIDENYGLTPKTARVLNNTFGITEKKELKKEIESKLSELLSSGEITKEEAKAAIKFFSSDKIGDALIARNTALLVASEQKELLNDKAAEIMQKSGLTMDDLYKTTEKYVGEDWTLSYTHLSKSEKKKAENGEITSSELKNIQNILNKIIKDNGGEYELTSEETKDLIKALGIPLDSVINIKKLFLSIITLGLAGTAMGSSWDKFSSLPAKISNPNAGEIVQEAVTNTSFHLGGLTGAIGALIGAGIQILRDVLRHEKAYGPQGGEEAGFGSVTNKTEAKMHKLKILAES